jgi:predicted DsbA family dithiol-disulfide isomerase
VRIERLRTEHDVKIAWVHFPLHPDTPAEGRSLGDLFARRNVDRKAMHAQMKARMDAEGLPYGERTMTYNSRLAQELGKWADTQPGGEAIHDALFRAYFVEARDISKPEVLLDIAGAVGLSADAAREVLERRTFKAAVERTGRSRAATASPGCRPSWPAATGSSALSLTRRWSGSSRRRRASPPRSRRGGESG